MNDFIEKINDDISSTYLLLDEDFRKKEYPNKDDYVKFMNSNKNNLSYQVYNCNSLSGNDHVYEVKDMNFNTFVFYEKAVNVV